MSTLGSAMASSTSLGLNATIIVPTLSGCFSLNANACASGMPSISLNLYPAPPPSADGARVPDAASLGPDPEGGPAPESAEAAGEPSADALSVNVNATPWARIEIDGVDVGETPLAGIPLRPGPHTFRAQLPDGRVLERSVEIDPDHRHVAFD